MLNDEDASIFVDWDTAALAKFAETANQKEDLPTQPVWVSTVAGSMTASSFSKDFAIHAAECVNGRGGDSLLVPTSRDQFLNLCARILQMGAHPFVQTCLQQLDQDDFLASLFLVTERAIVPAWALSTPPWGGRSPFS